MSMVASYDSGNKKNSVYGATSSVRRANIIRYSMAAVALVLLVALAVFI